MAVISPLPTNPFMLASPSDAATRASWYRRADKRLHLLVAACAALVAAIALLHRPAPHQTAPGGSVPVQTEAYGMTRSSNAGSGGKPPIVEPLVLGDLAPQMARKTNASIPFRDLGTDRPSPFTMPQSASGYQRARDCLASAMLYEAGDDRKGQAAVAQVVLNRLHHPAFPHSVCGVVFQGAGRSSGCQFTFTCDGALQRMPSAPAWRRAQEAAAAFLSGKTDPSVGMATHYHTDWVHPYWSATLDKIARVDTHLFFRWTGGWGRKAAFSATYSSAEPLEAKLAALSSAHRTVTLAPGVAAYQPAETPIAQPPSGLLIANAGEHLILVDGGSDGSRLALQGLDLCDGQTYCKVVGWDRRAAAYGSPQNPVTRTVAFLYVSDKRTGVEITLWDCTRYNRPTDRQCLSDANRRWITFLGNLSRAS